MMPGLWVSQAMCVATELGIPDELGAGPQSADAIAERVDANPDAVDRLLRMLTGKGLFAQDADGRFALAPMADALRSDVSGSVRGIVLFYGHRLHWEHWGQFGYCVKTGQPSVDALRGKPIFDYFDENPEFAAVFNTAMTSVSGTQIGLNIGWLAALQGANSGAH
jgi:Dimerisation domain